MRIVMKNLGENQENSGNNNQKRVKYDDSAAGIKMQVGNFLKFNKNVVPNKGMQGGKLPRKKIRM